MDLCMPTVNPPTKIVIYNINNVHIVFLTNLML